MTLFELIAANVTARDAAEHYGLRFGRNGRAVCPWHDDRHPDLTFYDSHCYCHACHNGGDAVALTAQLFNLSMSDAAAKLNSDFKLNISTDAQPIPTGPSRAELRKRVHERESRLWGTLCEIEREADKRLRMLCDSCEDYDRLWDDPRFTKALEARSRASLALENIQSKGVI